MFYYRSHGLNIKSCLALPELIRHEGVEDVTIDWGNLNFPSKALISGDNFSVTSQAIYLFWEDVGTFKITNGHEIIIDPTSQVDEQILKEVIFGPIFAVLLYQRGKLVLHASAVEINQGVIGFLGWTGSGKSTTAMALYQRGHSIVTDDILPVDLEEADYPVVYPGSPHLKLSDEDRFQIGKASHPKTNQKEKNFRIFADSFPKNPMPLKGIYILGKNEKSFIKPSTPQKTLKELIRHSYCLKLFSAADKQLNLKQCVELVRKVPIKTLKVKSSYQKLPELAKTIEEDITTESL